MRAVTSGSLRRLLMRFCLPFAFVLCVAGCGGRDNKKTPEPEEPVASPSPSVEPSERPKAKPAHPLMVALANPPKDKSIDDVLKDCGLNKETALPVLAEALKFGTPPVRREAVSWLAKTYNAESADAITTLQTALKDSDL